MNYLAHIFLSGADRRVQVGNFMADAVKGSSLAAYPRRIADGVRLHRAIDDFTDRHPAIKQAVQQLRPHFGRYSAALLDIYFDHLLASRFGEFSPVPLKRFSRRFYTALILNRRHLPARIKNFMWHFIGTDRLGRYATLDGMRESIGIMVRLGRMDISLERAIGYLSDHEEELWAVFRPFFTELQAFRRGYIQKQT